MLKPKRLYQWALFLLVFHLYGTVVSGHAYGESDDVFDKELRQESAKEARKFYKVLQKGSLKKKLHTLDRLSDNPEHFPLYRLALRDRHVKVRLLAIDGVGQYSLPQKRAIPVLLQALKDPSMKVRVNAVKHLKQFGVFVLPYLAVLTQKLTKTSPKVREQVLDLLDAMGPYARHIWLRSLKHPLRSVRERAFRTIAAYGLYAKQAFPIVKKALWDPSPAIRLSAVEYFQALGSIAHSVVPRLLQLYSSKNVSMRKAVRVQSIPVVMI